MTVATETIRVRMVPSAKKDNLRRSVPPRAAWRATMTTRANLEPAPRWCSLLFVLVVACGGAQLEGRYCARPPTHERRHHARSLELEPPSVDFQPRPLVREPREVEFQASSYQASSYLREALEVEFQASSYLREPRFACCPWSTSVTGGFRSPSVLTKPFDDVAEAIGHGKGFSQFGMRWLGFRTRTESTAPARATTPSRPRRRARP